MEVGAEFDKHGAFVKVIGQEGASVSGDAPVIGSICMDQIAIDLTAFPQSEVGTKIELISNDCSSKASLAFLAETAGVVPHAIISRISPKVPRSYKSAIPIPTVVSTTTDSMSL